MSLVRWPIGEEIRYDGTTHPLVAALPYYHLVEKRPDKHLAWRLKVRKRCHDDLAFRKKIIEACAADTLFFANTFLWIVEPRADGKIPFLTWAHQDPWLAAMAHYSGKRDIKGDKSRAQGESWLLVADYLREFLFLNNVFQGLVSLDENTADNPDNPDSLGWKIDFMHANLPHWMQVPGLVIGGKNRKLSEHTWHNPAKNNYIQCWAATGTAGKGGRRKRVGFDEAAFMAEARELIENLRAVTNCRNVFSTFNGKEDYFYELVTRQDNWLSLPLDWRDNPSQNQGLYTTDKGRLKLIDREFVHEPSYKFRLDGRVRSPWYDAECDRAGNNMIEIARELDRDPGGAKGRPFTESSLSHARQFVREPVRIGNFDFPDSDPTAIEEMQWQNAEGGPFRLWCDLDAQGLLPADDYCVGDDVGAGTGGDGSSNSVIEIWNGRGEQVGEFADNDISPEELARLTVALCYWLGRGRPAPFLVWEKNGPTGTQFTREIMRLNYPNVYYMKDAEDRAAKRTRRPGFHNSKTSKALQPLISALNNRQLVPRSKDLLRECGEYVFGKGDVEHPKAKNAPDESLAGVNHGDRAIAASMCVLGLQDRRMLKEMERKSKRDPNLWEAPRNSSAGRFWKSKRDREERDLSTSCVW